MSTFKGITVHKYRYTQSNAKEVINSIQHANSKLFGQVFRRNSVSQKAKCATKLPLPDTVRGEPRSFLIIV